ncbi:MAG TPA: 4Fe-4S dicluster domain-containing protein [Thermococcus sp.]|nr:4Fe-4S dicluster domain-containing protein [Thermococcus sp.]
MPRIKNLENCIGCFACYNVCPNEAIRIDLTNEGFYVLQINEFKCSDCGLCDKVCPILNLPIANEDRPVAYASWSKDPEVRVKSSSGGVFSELAKYVLKNGGIVYGVALDENMTAKHIRVDTEDELEKLRGSKYIPSFVGNAYREAIEELKRKQVLFSGTPCQIAALNNIVKVSKVKINNLITVDIVCHGVPSLKVFRMYLDYISKGRKVRKMSFRDKELGWSNYQIKIEFEDGVVYKATHRFGKVQDPFFKVYLMDLCLNKVCYNCPFSRIPRQGDITLGDFWGVPEDLKDEKGVSIVLVNNKKGKDFLEKVEGLEKMEVSLKLAAKSNKRIVSGDLSVPKAREKVLTAYNFEEIVRIARKEERRKVWFLKVIPKLLLRE